jgi:hypothetical protein
MEYRTAFQCYGFVDRLLLPAIRQLGRVGCSVGWFGIERSAAAD